MACCDKCEKSGGSCTSKVSTGAGETGGYVHALFYANDQGKKLPCYGPSGLLDARFVAKWVAAWLRNNGFVSWHVERWELRPDGYAFGESF